VNRQWHYKVTVTDAAGHALGGTVLTQFVLAGQVVGRETPSTHQLQNGTLSDTLVFPAQAVGSPLTVQTVVRSAAGSITLGWPILPQR
jgi:hypothetical protein